MPSLEAFHSPNSKRFEYGACPNLKMKYQPNKDEIRKEVERDFPYLSLEAQAEIIAELEKVEVDMYSALETACGLKSELTEERTQNVLSKKRKNHESDS
jgi:hypothetical protein